MLRTHGSAQQVLTPELVGSHLADRRRVVEVLPLDQSHARHHLLEFLIRHVLAGRTQPVGDVPADGFKIQCLMVHFAFARRTVMAASEGSIPTQYTGSPESSHVTYLCRNLFAFPLRLAGTTEGYLASTTEGHTDAPDETDASNGLHVAVQLLTQESFSFCRFVGQVRLAMPSVPERQFPKKPPALV